LVAQEIESEIRNTNLVQFYDSELFTWNYNMFGDLTLNYRNINSGISFGINDTMKNALLEFLDSGQAYNSYRKKNIAGNILINGGLAIVLSSYIPLYDNLLMLNFDQNKYDSNIRWTIGLAASGLISTIIGSFISTSGTESLFNSVNLFNRNKARELSK